ncbi:hypothetical protein TSMEX_009096 [Taenia solium]|eukprot:TsM_000278300 transcript=TsM_000278300 gene=TsM_000278300
MVHSHSHSFTLDFTLAHTIRNLELVAPWIVKLFKLFFIYVVGVDYTTES